MKKWYSIVLLSVVFLFSSIVSSSAEISSDELLNILKEKGIITDKDIEKATTSEEPTKKVAQEQEKEQEKDNFVVKTPRKPKSVNFIGRVQARYTYIENGDLDNVTYQNAFDTSEYDGFSIRRVRLRWYGEVIDKLQYHIHVSVDGDSADADDDEVGVKLQDAYFTYAHHPYFNVTAGQFKARFSPSYLVAGPVLPLCERPLVVDKIGRKREIGISLESAKNGEFDDRGHGAKLHDKPFYYAVGLYNGNTFNHLENDNDNMMLTAMVVYRPIKYINFGTSYAFNQTGNDDATKRLNIWDFNSALDVGPFHAQIEYIQEHGHGTNRRYGYGIQGQYDLTDTFQLTARYDEYDPDRTVDNGFDSRWYTVGYNWFIHGQDIKWQLNYTLRKEMHANYHEDNDILVTHFQILF
ncbi:MAG: OprO/OprP family phosphate-selective porin [Proteobacteria bacterium]|nr:OprO/OprP family phosphate-selective porin [Pseudomonadota bacterium]